MRVLQQELRSAQLEWNGFVLQEPELSQKQGLVLFPLPKQTDVVACSSPCSCRWSPVSRCTMLLSSEGSTDLRCGS